LSYEQAVALETTIDHALDAFVPAALPDVSDTPHASPGTTPATLAQTPAFEDASPVSATIIAQTPAQGAYPGLTCRQAGDGYLLLEYGQNVLDLALRLRIHVLMQAISHAALAGVLELSPGVRSLQVRYDSQIIRQSALVARLLELDRALPDVGTLKIPTRIVHLPMAFEDSATLAAVDRYRETVRAQAPWLPNNVDFIQRINGLSDRSQVEQIVYDASYMVLGLGDVYLGAPCAVPLDPRHRLLTSKYNPARTHTAEGTVGIGGVYMCIYGMDSPGGYQLVGRTLPIWNSFLKNPAFQEGEPWLLKFFDQVRFYPVTEAELDRLREDFREGTASVRIEESVFDYAKYLAFLQDNDASISEFQQAQQQAFTTEVALWKADDMAAPDAVEAAQEELALAPGETLVNADMCGNIWKVMVEVGDTVAAGDTLVVVEAMKMELSITAPESGKVSAIRCQPGRPVNTGDPLIVLAAMADAPVT